MLDHLTCFISAFKIIKNISIYYTYTKQVQILVVFPHGCVCLPSLTNSLLMALFLCIFFFKICLIPISFLLLRNFTLLHKKTRYKLQQMAGSRILNDRKGEEVENIKRKTVMKRRDPLFTGTEKQSLTAITNQDWKQKKSVSFWTPRNKAVVSFQHQEGTAMPE